MMIRLPDIEYMKREPLAYRIYPEPDGYSYFEEDLQDEHDVRMLFDYCQIMEAVIWIPGWEYLIAKFGYFRLHEIDKQSGWLGSPSPEEYIEDVHNLIASLPAQ